MRNRLASRLAKSMGTTAALRLLALQTKHAYKKADGSVIVHSFNGEAMFVELVKLLDEVETDRDVKKHLKNVEKLRDTPMHDNCTGQEWSERMVDFNKSNMHIDVPYADLRFSKLIVGMMPKILATRAAVMVDKLKDESKFGDRTRCSSAFRRSLRSPTMRSSRRPSRWRWCKHLRSLPRRMPRPTRSIGRALRRNLGTTRRRRRRVSTVVARSLCGRRCGLTGACVILARASTTTRRPSCAGAILARRSRCTRASGTMRSAWPRSGPIVRSRRRSSM